MGTTIGTAYVQILPSTEGISSNLTSALNGAAQTAGTSSGKTLGSSIAKGLGTTAAALGTAAVGAVTGVIKMANETAKLGDEIDKTSQKVGVSAEQYQVMQFAAEHCGFSVSTFQTAAKSLANTDFSGNVWDAVEAIQAIEDPAERAAAAEELLGVRAAQEMTPLWQNTETLGDYKNALMDLGGIMSNDAVAASAAYEDALTDMQTAFSGVRNTLMSEFLPSMTEVVNGVALLASGSTEGIEQIRAGFDDFVSGLMDKIPTIIETGGTLLMTLAETIIDNLPTIIEVGANVLLALANGIANRLPDLIPKCVQIILTIVNGLIQNLPQLVSAGLQLITGLAKGLIQAIPQLISNAPQIISSLVTAIIQCLPEMAQAGWQLIQGLGRGILDGFASLWQTVRQAAGNLVANVKGFFGIASPSKLFRDEIGKQLMAGMAAGIASGEGLVESALDDVTDMAASDINVGLTGNSAAASKNNELGLLLDAMRNMQFDFYMDGRKITDAITIRQRQAARSGGFA